MLGAACTRLCSRHLDESSVLSTSVIVPGEYCLLLALLMWSYFLLLDLLAFIVRNLGKLEISTALLYLLARFQPQYRRSQCHHRMSEPLISCFAKHHYSSRSFIVGIICWQYLLHLSCEYRIKYFRKMYEQYCYHEIFCTYPFDSICKVMDWFLRKPFLFFQRIF